MLTEEIHLPRGSDARFYTKFKSKHKKNECFEYSKIRNDEFTICHYAGNVTYKVAGLLDKNKDSSNNSLQTLLQTASPSFLRKKIFGISDLEGAGKPSISKRAVGMVRRFGDCSRRLDFPLTISRTYFCPIFRSGTRSPFLKTRRWAELRLE